MHIYPLSFELRGLILKSYYDFDTNVSVWYSSISSQLKTERVYLSKLPMLTKYEKNRPCQIGSEGQKSHAKVIIYY